MSIIRRLLVIGGGIGGMSLAIRMRQQGVAVDLIDRDPEWRVYGAGISVTGPTLRAFGILGVLDAVLEGGAFGDGIRLCSLAGETIAVVPLPRVAGPDVPANGGILRPVLHAIMSERTLGCGVQVRLGVTADALDDTGDGVTVRFSDGSTGRYDLVVGADGAMSSIRRMIFPAASGSRFTGQGCWRVVAERPASIDRPTFFVGGPVKAGVVPVSAHQMYLFCLNAMPENVRIPQDELAPRLAALLEGFGGAITAVRAGLTPETNVVYRPLEALLLPPPWHVGRIALLGDAVHSTTPHLASGAGISVEDGLVLAEELAAAPSVEAALTRYVARRFERCRLVVENSVRLGEIETQGGRPEDHQALMAASAQALALPI